MRITYPNAYRLWASLHRGNPHQLFLATPEEPRIGDRVPIELGLPGRSQGLQLTCEVVERRPAGGRSPAGISVKLSDEQYKACREYLGIGAVSSPEEPRRTSGTTTADTRPAPHVLVADDDEDILAFLERALSRFRVDITGVADGETALRMIKDLRPRLVVMDVVMPALDGTEVCHRMRSDDTLAHIPVILVSALNQDELEAVADKAGANDCLAKPVDLARLLNIVGEYLRD